MSVIHADCLDAMAAMEPASIDAIVTDPPYGLEFMGKEWDKLDSGLPQEAVWKGRRGKGGSKVGTDDSKPASRHHVSFGGGQQGFKRCSTCGKRAFSGSPCVCPEPVWVIEYNAGPPSSAVRMQRWHQQWAEAAYRVAKPSAYLLAFGGTRTVHRMTVALEDAGWIIRDMLVWMYLSGFPKSRASLKPSWEPIVLARKPGPLRPLDIDGCRMVGGPTAIMDAWEPDASLCASCAADAESPERLGAPATWASTTPRHVELLPSEPARSGDTDRLGTGCSDGTTEAPTATSSSIGRSGRTPTGRSRKGTSSTTSTGTEGTTGSRTCASCGATSMDTTTIAGMTSTPNGLPLGTTSDGIALGRWPANVLTVGTELFDEPWPGMIGVGPETSRVFSIPKADRADREPVLGGQVSKGPQYKKGGVGGTGGKRNVQEAINAPWRENHHPTVKPTDLMRHLVRLVTPSGGTVLDPFLGSGTTALAAEMEGFAWIGIEREEEYVRIAEARLNGTQRGLGLESA